MRRLACFLLLLVAAAPAQADPPGQRFVSIAFHDVVDRRDELDSDAVTTRVLVEFFDWLKGTGWSAVSLDDIAAAAHGVRPLPAKAILITFDDGAHSLYTRVFPLLQAYRYPAVGAVVGSWMEDTPDGMVLYSGKKVPRSNFISWAEAREMEASGLVEIASHSYNLHSSVQSNPQGNMEPAATTWRYDPAIGTYEDDAQYRARLRADLARSRALMAANLGHPPRTLVWPFGRYTGPGLEVAKQLGFRFALALEPEPAYTSELNAIPRYFPSRNPTLADIARNLRFEPGRPTTRRIACLTLDALAAASAGPAQDEALGHIIDGLRALGTNTVVIDANAALPSPATPLGEVYFPTRLRPLRKDLLGRATWQIRTRGGADVFLHLPVVGATAAVGAANVPDLFADMLRYTRPDGLVIDAPLPLPATAIVDDRPDDIRARRAGLDPGRLDPPMLQGLAGFRAAAAIDPRLRLMLALRQPAGPPDWADLALLPPSDDIEQIGALAKRFRDQGWLQPPVAGRIAFSLPAEPERQIEALRLAQRHGASDFALCPEPPGLPPPAALSAAFSAATYPYRP
jgi:peptidoglycan/xylan/chitin deacetylase (PgdA/CDA1 family)